MSQTADNMLCHYRKLGHDTHVFTFMQGTRAAIQQWATHIEAIQLAREWYNTGMIYLLLDARQAPTFPIRAMFEVLSDYNRAYPQLTPPQIHLAFVRHPQTDVLDIYPMMAELLDPPVNLSFFTEDVAAEQWLQQQHAE